MTAVTTPTPLVAPPPLGQPWRRAWLTGLATWGVAEATYLTINALFWLATGRSAPPPAEFFNVWDRWDTGHYLRIATLGYNVGTENTAFFPLYPILIRLVNPVFPGEALAAGLFVASVSCIVALAVIHRLVEDLFDVGTAQRTTYYVMASPLAFYLVAAYPESLFVALCAGSLYCMRRGAWWYAGGLAGLASVTRYFGVVLGLAFVIEYLRQRNWRPLRARWDALAILLVPSGLVAFMIYSARTFGDPLNFSTLQQQVWGHTLSAPWQGFATATDQIDRRLTDGASPFESSVLLNVIDTVGVLITIGLLIACVVGPWRLGAQSWYLIAFGAAGFVAALLTPMLGGLPPMHGLPRYALETTAVFIVLARMGASRAVDRAYLLPAVAIQAMLLTAYFTGVLVS